MRPGLLESFGEVPGYEYDRMRGPFVAVYRMDPDSVPYRENGMRFFAKLYERDMGKGELLYTGYHVMAREEEDLCRDIEQNMQMIRYPRGTADRPELVCVYA